MAKPSRRKFGIQQDRRGTELLLVHTIEVLLERFWCMTLLNQASQSCVCCSNAYFRKNSVFVHLLL